MLSEKDKDFIINEVLKQLEGVKPSKWVVWGRAWFHWVTPPLLIGAMVWAINFKADFTASQFTPEQKGMVLERVKNIPDDFLLNTWIEHTQDPSVHMSKQAKDSVYVSREEFRELIKSAAIDQYNNKRSQDRMIDAIERIDKTVKAMDYKLDKKFKPIDMPQDIIKQMSNRLIAWILGLIAALIVAAIAGGFKFYMEWSNDEAVEDAVKDQEKALMFDSPEQKEETKDHVLESPSALEQRLKIEKDIMFQESVLKQLKQMSHIDTLNADQMYQIKKELEILKRNR